LNVESIDNAFWPLADNAGRLRCCPTAVVNGAGGSFFVQTHPDEGALISHCSNCRTGQRKQVAGKRRPCEMLR
jgi:hypothetical protein